MSFFHKDTSPSIGLVLDGGGARGPYQIGVMLAMRKYGLTDKVKGLSCASIGAFDGILFLFDDGKKMVDFWERIDNDIVLTKKDNKVSALISSLTKKEGYYSRDGLIKLINSTIDLRNHLLNKQDMYVSLAEEVKDEKGKTVSYNPVYIKLNGLPSEDILKLLLATSAIPMVFDPVEYKGKTYVDPMKADNEPYKPLLGLDPDMLFVVPLNNSHFKHVYNSEFPKTIVDFASPVMMELPKLNMVDFSSGMTEKYISEGYQVGKMILDYLYRNGLLVKESKEVKNKKPKPYYSLASLGIINIEFAKMKTQDILKDMEKGI
jgi:NTE family protein